MKGRSMNHQLRFLSQGDSQLTRNSRSYAAKTEVSLGQKSLAADFTAYLTGDLYV